MDDIFKKNSQPLNGPKKNLKENKKLHTFNGGGPTKEEIKCVKSFYDKTILKTRNIATNTIVS